MKLPSRIKTHSTTFDLQSKAETEVPEEILEHLHLVLVKVNLPLQGFLRNPSEVTDKITCPPTLIVDELNQLLDGTGVPSVPHRYLQRKRFLET